MMRLKQKYTCQKKKLKKNQLKNNLKNKQSQSELTYHIHNSKQEIGITSYKTN